MSTAPAGRMSRWIQTFSRVGRDGIELSRAILMTARGGSTMRASFKPVLLEQARQSNQVATSLLRIEREFSLFRYHGWRGYVHERLTGPLFRFRLFSSSQQQELQQQPLSTISAGTADGGAGGAKVAFMITSSMKQELSDKLGYDADQIKRMTPQQASIVLFHAVSPETYDARLPTLEHEFVLEQEEKQRQQEQARLLELQQEQEEQRQRFEAISTTATTTSNPLLSSTTAMTGTETAQGSLGDSATPSPLTLSESNNKTDSLQGHNPYGQVGTASGVERMGKTEIVIDSTGTPVGTTTNGFSDIWYEVVEIRPDGERLRVGLYQEEEEAILGLQTREMIRDMRLERAPLTEPRNTFDMRRISKAEALLGSS